MLRLQVISHSHAPTAVWRHFVITDMQIISLVLKMYTHMPAFILYRGV